LRKTEFPVSAAVAFMRSELQSNLEIPHMRFGMTGVGNGFPVPVSDGRYGSEWRV